MLIEAVLVDLDDTLYPQSVWLDGAWDAVVAAAPSGIPRRWFKSALIAEARLGSDRGHLIDRALAAVRAQGAAVTPLVDAFRRHTPATMDCFDGTPEALARLRARVPIALLSDGHPSAQRAKLTALGLSESFDAVVLSDELGRALRKPHPVPFVAAARALDVRPSACVHVGDRPAKDVAGAIAAGLLGAVRVRSGEYAGVPDVPAPLASVTDIVAAADWILARLPTDTSPAVHQRAI